MTEANVWRIPVRDIGADAPNPEAGLADLRRTVRCDTGIHVEGVPFDEVRELWAARRAEASCQVVRDSILPRGLAAAWGIRMGGAWVGYGGVWIEHHPGRIMDFYVQPGARADARRCFDAFCTASGAEAIEAQTNMPDLHDRFREVASNVRTEHLLFTDGPALGAVESVGRFRPGRPGDGGPEGAWVIELDGGVVAAGGLLSHYNPPWRDLYMEVARPHRRRGIGSLLVQELRRVCVEEGSRPAARCNPENEASRRTLLRGGLVECGRLVVGDLDRP